MDRSYKISPVFWIHETRNIDETWLIWLLDPFMKKKIIVVSRVDMLQTMYEITTLA